MGVPQFDFPSLKQFVARRAREIGNQKRGWEQKTVWWKDAWNDIKRLVGIVLKNEPGSVVKPVGEWTETVWADASGTGGGYVLQESGRVKGWRWSERQRGQPIHVLEAWALLQAVREWKKVRSDDAGVILKTDNTLLCRALETTKATGFIFSGAVAEIFGELRGIAWEVEWVPSEENVADAPSRGM